MTMLSSQLMRGSQLYPSLVPSLVNRTFRNYYSRRNTCLQDEETRKNQRMIFESKPKWYPKPVVFREKPTEPEKQPYLDFQQLQQWVRSEQMVKEIESQKYDERRVAELGPDLAALHFFTYRHAAVKLEYSDEWITGSLTRLAEELPHSYVDGLHVEAIDCSRFQDSGIRYEGLLYLAGLERLRWLSLRNQPYIDVWCIDRIFGLVGDSLEYLDVSSCKLNIGCICALSKFPVLESLIVKYPRQDYETLWALSALEFRSPNLLIKVEKETDVNDQEVEVLTEKD